MSHSNDPMTSPAALPPTLPPAESGRFPEPGQYTGSSLRIIVGTSKTLPHANDHPFPPSCNGVNANPNEGRRPKEPCSLEVGITVLVCFITYSFSIHTLTLASLPKVVCP